MNEISLANYYKYAAIVPAGIVTACYTLYAIIYILFDFGKNYKSEWMTGNDPVILTILVVIANAISISILSTSLFLNNYSSIRNHQLKSILAWFLLPCIWIGHLLFKHFRYLIFSNFEFNLESLFVFSNTIPFLVGLFLTFIKFKQQVNYYKSLNS